MSLFDKIKNALSSEIDSKEGAETSTIAVLDKISVYKRTTYMPVVEKPDADEPQEALISKIGGQAYLPPGEEYPTCPACEQPLTLFLQLNPQQLPEANDLDLEPDKLIQLFYCTNMHPNCELEHKGWQAYSKIHLTRLVPIPAQEVSLPAHTLENSFEANQIIEWVAQDDYPDWHEMQLGEAGLSEAEITLLEEGETGVPKAADKLGGWPYWVQGVEYPHCSDCGVQMQMIFQLDSAHHLPYTFGDAGMAHLYQCRIHKNVLAFSWASY